MNDFTNVSNWKSQSLRLFGAGSKILPSSKVLPWERLWSMPRTRNHTWRITFWMDDLLFQTTQLKMPSGHLLLEERTGCLLILPKELLHQQQCIVSLRQPKQTISMFILTSNTYSCTCQTHIGSTIRLNWTA